MAEVDAQGASLIEMDVGSDSELRGNDSERDARRLTENAADCDGVAFLVLIDIRRVLDSTDAVSV